MITFDVTTDSSPCDELCIFSFDACWCIWRSSSIAMVTLLTKCLHWSFVFVFKMFDQNMGMSLKIENLFFAFIKMLRNRSISICIQWWRHSLFLRRGCALGLAPWLLSSLRGSVLLCPFSCGLVLCSSVQCLKQDLHWVEFIPCTVKSNNFGLRET